MRQVVYEQDASALKPLRTAQSSRYREHGISIESTCSYKVSMASEVDCGIPERRLLGLLRIAALIALLAGAIGSVAFTLRAGQHNNSRVLMVLFVLWVLSPFVAIGFASVVSKRWSALTRAALHSVTLVLALASLAIYGYVAVGPPRAKTAFVFVVVPPASWLLTAIVVPIAALISRR
jgi:hypothetical protein